MTYRKAPKTKRSSVESEMASTEAPANPSSGLERDGLKIGSDAPEGSHNQLDPESRPQDSEEPPRNVSRLQQNGPVPQVIFANNRHIIPENLYPMPSHTSSLNSEEPNSGHSPHNDQNTRGKQGDSSGLGDQANGQEARPYLHKHNTSWGATTVNTKLQEQILREVFGPPIRRRPRSRHQRLQRVNEEGGHRRPTTKRTSLISPTHDNNSDGPDPRAPNLSSKSEAMTEASAKVSSSTQQGHDDFVCQNQPASAETENPQTGLEENGESGGMPIPESRTIKRRHSDVNLRRKGTMDSNERSELEYYEDDGYGGDEEDAFFAMDTNVPSAAGALAKRERPIHTDSQTPAKSASKQDQNTSNTANESSIVRDDSFGMARPPGTPSNPKQAQLQPDERVQHFLLLEDLTSGMDKPCVLDLKMGTRQYGIDADEKKKKSQRRKCKATTSQQLGVRLCGMQVWNAKEQSYLFEDKYFGRDLKAGHEFQASLTRFLYDGLSYTSVSTHIAGLLEKISMLENIIRDLPGYRFYSSSLLVLYDGGARGSPESAKTGRTTSGDLHIKAKSSINIKIVDFANCVTAEDELPESVPCPPHDPDGIDKGYLRGLYSLRKYLLRIWEDAKRQEDVEMGRPESLDTMPSAWKDDGPAEDQGDVSI